MIFHFASNVQYLPYIPNTRPAHLNPYLACLLSALPRVRLSSTG